jgi:predicted MFS family arabinose efflux permease
MAVYSTVFMGSAPIGALIAGAISQRFDVTTSMIVGGTIVTTVASVLFWLQRDRKPLASSSSVATPVPRGRPSR